MSRDGTRRYLSGATRGVDEALRQIDVVASSGAVNRQEAILDVAGLETAAYLANPVVLWAHDYEIPPIGKTLSLSTENDQLLARIEFAPTPFAEEIFGLFKGRFLNAVSLGFQVLESERPKGQPERWTKSELLEISVVPIPADRGALQRHMAFLSSIAATPDRALSVIPYLRTPLAPEETDWDGPAQMREAEVDALKIMCTWYDAEEPDVKGSYKLPHHMAGGSHACVWRTVAAAMAALMGGRGGVDIPAGDVRGCYNHLSRHYEDFEKEAPEMEGLDTADLVLLGAGDEELWSRLERALACIKQEGTT